MNKNISIEIVDLEYNDYNYSYNNGNLIIEECQLQWSNDKIKINIHYNFLTSVGLKNDKVIMYLNGKENEDFAEQNSVDLQGNYEVCLSCENIK